jgi:maltose alpha-D-glucosyltransferase / alpha-amylase
MRKGRPEKKGPEKRIVKKLASATDPYWYKDAIIYELHVRAFADSNGDGIGDFPGLLSRLDYLQDLGVTCIWLLPFFPSPLRDDGYDISNYTDVNPSYGTLDDFKAFLEAAHQRGMQVMIELVINHTSDQHPWFRAARLAPPGSPERAMYVWSDSGKRYKDARIIFTDTEKSNWTWDEAAKAYYWHRFFSHQPDLNFDNHLVIEEVLKAMRFWLDMGVDALRMDAIPYLCERDGTSCENLPETHAVVKVIRAAIDAGYANRLILAEANQWPADVRPYFGDGDECHMAFHFPLMPRIYMALRQEDRLPITDIMAQTPPIPDNCQWALFLRNHDELTLEMVTDDERDYMYFAYSADPRMRINVGIRRRLAPLVDNNRRRIELLNSLLLSFPGTPILYYGDEIGMGDNIYLGDRNGVRTPMQWTSDRNAGFSKCDPARLFLPVIMDYIYGYQGLNVEAQLGDQSSLLHWTRNMIALRKLFQVFGRGTLTFLNPSNRKILAYLRNLEQEDGTHETVLCVANLSRFAQPVSLDLSAFAGSVPVEMIGYVPFPAITETPYTLSLAPYAFLWLELQAPQTEPGTIAAFDAETWQELPADEALERVTLSGGWPGLFAGRGAALLEAALPAWLPRQRWFGAKARTIQSVRIHTWVELRPPADEGRFDIAAHGDGMGHSSRMFPALCFLDIAYSEGPAEVYQIPLAVSTGQEGAELNASQPASILATLHSSDGDIFLHDASWREDFQQILLELIAANTSLALAGARTEVSLSAARPDGANSEPDHATQPAIPIVARVQADSSSASLAESLQRTQAEATANPPVVPAPLTAQPGEAAGPPRSEAPAPAPVNTQRLQPRESPASGESAPPGGRLDASASTSFRRAEQRAASRLGSAEQSNTSILYGREFFLKLFRKLEPGQNPDVEIGRFLTEVARFPHIPPFLGEISLTLANTEKTTLALLQGLVVDASDGWEWFLGQVAEMFAHAAELAPHLDLSPDPPGATVHSEIMPPAILESSRPSFDAARLLGRRTAELHIALATPTENEAFSSQPLTQDDLARDAERIEAQIKSTLDLLRLEISRLDEPAADAAALLLSRRPELVSRVRALASLPPGGKRIRIHGDFHLGQTLRTRSATEDAAVPKGSETGDFIFLDFEGEPARPLVERRRKQSPLKDVAGMMRSFSYAAQFALNRSLDTASTNKVQILPDALRTCADSWRAEACAQFLGGYRNAMRDNLELLPAPEPTQTLLEAYLLEKALYELVYELNNRPAWLGIPISGILSL